MKLRHILLALLLLISTLFIFVKYQLSTTYVIQKIDRLGGVESINAEISLLLDSIYLERGDKFFFLDKSDLKDFPLIAALGNSVRFIPASQKFPAHIKIRYGSHFLTKFIYIFDPRVTSDLPYEGLDRIADNIYITHSSL